MLYGSNYIFIQIADRAHRTKLPQYVIDLYFPQEVNPQLFQFPNSVMIKFRSKEGNIDEAYSYLKMILSGKEWNVKFL